MKKLFIALFLLSGVIGCNKSRRSSLLILDHFIDIKTDSVYSQLLEMQQEESQLSQSDKMYYGILKLKCQNLLDISFDSINSIIEIANYYDKNGPYSKALLAHYLLGRAFMTSGDELMAVNSFYQCLSLEFKELGKEDYIQLSKVHSQLAEIYRNQNLTIQELQELEHARDCSLTGGDTLLSIIFEGLKVSPYKKMNRHDSVLSIINNVQKKYKTYGRSDMAAEIEYNAIPIHLERKCFDKARKSIDIFEQESGVFDSNGNIETDREIFYYLKGLYYQEVNKLDSAEYQYRHLLNFDKDLNNVEAAYKGLLSLYKLVGNADSIGKYANLYCETNDSVHTKSLSAEIARLKAMYNFTHFQIESKKLKEEAERTKLRNTIFLIVFIVIIVITGRELYSYRMRKIDKINLLLAEYDRTLQIIDDLKGDKEEMIRLHQEELNKIINSLEHKGVTMQGDKKEGFDEKLMNKFKTVGEKGNRVMSISIEDWQSLLLAVSETDQKFMLFLSKSNLTENERKVAVLIRLHFDDYEIKNIFDSYGSSLPNYKNRINKKLFRQEGAKTLRRLIYAWKGN